MSEAVANAAAAAVANSSVQSAAPKAGDPAATPEVKQEALAPKFGVLARKEKAIINKQREMQAKEAAIAKRLEEFEAKEKTWAERERLFKEAPEKALEEYGHSYQSLTDRVLAGGQVTPELLKKELEDFKKSTADEKKQAEEARKAAAAADAEKAVTQYKESLKSFVTEKAADYKLVNLFDKDCELIYETIEAYYAGDEKKGIKPGKVLSNDEAAGLVEKYLRKLVEDANGAINPPAPKVDPSKEPIENGFKESKTLTNSLHSSTPSALSPKSEADRMRRAMAALDLRK